MYLKRLPCLIMALVMLLFCSCGPAEEISGGGPSSPDQDGPLPSGPVTLLYRASDSVNPYKAVSRLNRQLSLLMYDPLVKLDASYQPVYILAKSVDFNGKTCTVTLRDAVFSDGSPVTSSDVIYSMDLAKNSELIYSYQLENAVSFNRVDDKTLTVSLKKADPYFANLLDFPIIKSGSDNLTDENKIALPPVGSGRYVIDRANGILTANGSHIGGAPPVGRIELIDAPDDEVIKYNLESGNVSIYNTDLSDGVLPSMTGAAVPVRLNSLIYVGVNMNNSLLSDVRLRYALSYALDRAAVCGDAYYSYAEPASGLFNPVWNDAGGLQNIPSSPDIQNVVANLEQMGYNNKDADGFYVDGGGKRISLTLTAYSGNKRRLAAAELIKSQLESAGIRITLRALDWDGYTAALSSGDFDLYVAETRLLNNMDVTELVTAGGSLAYGLRAPSSSVPANGSVQPAGTEGTEAGNGTAAENDGTGTAGDGQPNGGSLVPSLEGAVAGFYNEQLSLIDIINAFNDEFPLIPVCYRCGVTVFDVSLDADNASSVSDVYFKIKNTVSN